MTIVCEFAEVPSKALFTLPIMKCEAETKEVTKKKKKKSINILLKRLGLAIFWKNKGRIMGNYNLIKAFLNDKIFPNPPIKIDKTYCFVANIMGNNLY